CGRNTARAPASACSHSFTNCLGILLFRFPIDSLLTPYRSNNPFLSSVKTFFALLSLHSAD
ncbi:MAG TPA: hypothetical protein PLA87_23100, partial [Pseudomonadota bacterium]|nr:hypothetical protein [Pseudomonadota bacterium]